MTSHPDKPKRWRPWRFRLSTLMLLMVVFGLTIGWWIDHQATHRQLGDLQREVEELRPEVKRKRFLEESLFQYAISLATEALTCSNSEDGHRFLELAAEHRSLLDEQHVLTGGVPIRPRIDELSERIAMAMRENFKNERLNRVLNAIHIGESETEIRSLVEQLALKYPELIALVWSSGGAGS